MLISVRGQVALGLLNADRRDRSLENFQGSYRKPNPGLPVLWRNVSTNCWKSGECSMHKKWGFDELLKNCSSISGKGRNNSVLPCVSLSPGPHASSSSFSARRSGTKREKRETEQNSSEVKKPVLTYLFSIYVLTSRCLCKHSAWLSTATPLQFAQQTFP